MEKVTVNAELLLVLPSKQAWINRVPACLPEKLDPWEQWLWVDANGNIFISGADFTAAEKQGSYPCKLYRLQKVSAVNQ